MTAISIMIIIGVCLLGIALGLGICPGRRRVEAAALCGEKGVELDACEIAARLMVRELPPCETIRFDENARAREDFSALIIGFGGMGQAVLRQLVMNGQFCGSTFRADIFDADMQAGPEQDCELLRQYDIRFHAADGKSDALDAFLEDHGASLRYIALCTGSEDENRELARVLARRMKLRGAAFAIVECGERRLGFTLPGEAQPRYRCIDALDIEQIDRMAMAINHSYCAGNGKTPRENWEHCDDFGKMSSRASANFYPAVLRAAGKTADQVLRGDWPPPDGMLENLAITEHMRWCAFHFAMGFKPMSEAEYAERADRFRREMREKGATSLRVSKDMDAKAHACLVPWEALDALSERESALTGRRVDYKQMDRNNILALADVLRGMNEIPQQR